MKPGLKISSCPLVITLLLIVSGVSFAEEVTANLVSSVLQSFDPQDADEPAARTWAVFPSKFGIDQEGKKLWDIRMVDAWPEALFGKNRKNADLKVLGLHGKFLRKGYNYVEIVPGTGEGENFQPEPIPFPGRPRVFDLWIWGSNHNYYLDVHIRDANGIIHVVPLGSIRHIGWKNLNATIPGSIPQTWQYIPKHRPLVITKLVLWTRPEEKVDDFYMYIDQLKVLTDLFESRYDGDNLSEVEKLQEVWGSQAD